MNTPEAPAAHPLGAAAGSAFWRPMETAPKDDTKIIILFDSATVDIVKLCWWNDGIGCDFELDTAARGWWSYIHSVTQELIDPRLMQPVGWMPHPDRPNGRAEMPRPKGK